MPVKMKEIDIAFVTTNACLHYLWESWLLFLERIALKNCQHPFFPSHVSQLWVLLSFYAQKQMETQYMEYNGSFVSDYKWFMLIQISWR